MQPHPPFTLLLVQISLVHPGGQCTQQHMQAVLLMYKHEKSCKVTGMVCWVVSVVGFVSSCLECFVSMLCTMMHS